MSSRQPFIEDHLRIVVTVPDAEERFTASVEDSLQLEVDRQVRQRGIETGGGLITNFIRDDEVVFDLEDDNATVRELELIQEEIEEAFVKFTSNSVEVDADDIRVTAESVRTFTARLGD